VSAGSATRKKPEQETDGGAKNETRDNWEIERGVSGAMYDVTGKPAQTERKFAAEIE